MKKLISIICALGVLCGMTSAMAAGTLSLDDTSFLSGDYMTVQEEVLANGDHVGITINADGISDTSKFGTSCEDFSAFKIVLEYDPAVLEVDPWGNADGTAFYDLTTFQAVYGGRAPKLPTVDTDGIISTAAAHTIVEINTPGQIGMSIANGTKFFSVNGDFLTIYFTVLDKDADAEVNVKLLQAVDKTPANIPVDTLVAESLSVKVAGMGASAPVLADFAALNTAIAAAEAVEADKYVSVEAVNAALAAAKAIDQAAETDQAKVDAAAKAINDAIAALELKPVASVDAEKGEVQYGKSTFPGKKTAGFATTVTPANGGAFKKLTANIGNGTVNNDFVIYDGVSISATTVFGLNITQVPEDVTITVNSVKAE